MTIKITHSIRQIRRALSAGSREPLESLQADITTAAEARNQRLFSIALSPWNEAALTEAVLQCTDDLQDYTEEVLDEHTILTFNLPGLTKLIERLIYCDVGDSPQTTDEMQSLAAGICLLFDTTLAL